jgi:hypothetical protein
MMTACWEAHTSCSTCRDQGIDTAQQLTFNDCLPSRIHEGAQFASAAKQEEKSADHMAHHMAAVQILPGFVEILSQQL